MEGVGSHDSIGKMIVQQENRGLLEIEKGGMLLPTSGGHDGETRAMVEGAAAVDDRRTGRWWVSMRAVIRSVAVVDAGLIIMNILPLETPPGFASILRH